MTDDEPVSEFGEALFKLCMRATKQARASNDPLDAFGDMIERLASALGATIGYAAQGKPRAIEDLLSGAEAYIAEEAARVARIYGRAEH